MAQGIHSSSLRVEAILKAADRHRVPIISPYRQFAVEGGLISYGPDTADIFRRSTSYVDRILKGELPDNLPAHHRTSSNSSSISNRPRRSACRFVTHSYSSPTR